MFHGATFVHDEPQHDWRITELEPGVVRFLQKIETPDQFPRILKCYVFHRQAHHATLDEVVAAFRDDMEKTLERYHQGLEAQDAAVAQHEKEGK